MIALPYIQNNLFLISTALIFLGLAGCKNHTKSLPAPLAVNAEYELEGRVHRIWGGDSFEFGDSNELHYIMIRGVDSPKPGQPYFDEAKEHLIKSISGRTSRLSIVGRDQMMREFADVFSCLKTPEGTSQGKETADAIETNIGLNLIQNGFGWYDGMEFEGSEALKQAELEAREKRIGLWAQDNPVAPWDFEEH